MRFNRKLQSPDSNQGRREGEVLPLLSKALSDCSRFLNKIWGPITAVGTRFLRCEGRGLEDIGWNSKNDRHCFLQCGKFEYVYIYICTR